MLSVAEICVDHGGVNVFHVCVYICGVVCVVSFVRLGVVCCVVVGVRGEVTLGLSVMRVDGGVLSWVVCVFRRVDVVCWCLHSHVSSSS